MIRNLDDFYLNKDEPNKSCLLALRHFILETDPKLSETQKYGMPCFCYKSKPLCYLWVDKKTTEPYILLVDGDKVEHSALIKGSRARMKILPINPNSDLPVDSIAQVLETAISIHQSS